MYKSSLSLLLSTSFALLGLPTGIDQAEAQVFEISPAAARAHDYLKHSLDINHADDQTNCKISRNRQDGRLTLNLDFDELSSDRQQRRVIGNSASITVQCPYSAVLSIQNLRLVQYPQGFDINTLDSWQIIVYNQTARSIIAERSKGTAQIGFSQIPPGTHELFIDMRATTTPDQLFVAGNYLFSLELTVTSL